MDEKFNKLIDFIGQSFNTDADIEPLQQLVEEEFELTELVDLVSQILERDDSYQILNCIFLGLTQKSTSSRKRMQLIEKLITDLVIETDSTRTASNILNMMLLEVDKLKTGSLTRLANTCIEVMNDSESSTRTSWKEILPTILRIIQDEKSVSFSGADMTGVEFKSDMIRTICRMNITTDIVIPVACMFREISMINDEHEKVVNKLCEMFEIIETKDLPMLVKELLYLCREDHSVIVFLKLRRFFEKNLYSSTGDSVITNELKREITNSQLAILGDIEDFAKISRLNDLIKLCKNASNASCLLLDPFLLAVLLILSCIPAYEAQISDLLRTLITQAVNEQERKKESAWLCDITNTDFDIDKLFSKTIQSGLCDHEKVVEGLVSLSFVLLAVSGIKSKESSLKKVWRIGRIVLVSVIKKHRNVEKTVLRILTDRIITGCVSQQYTDCLLHLCNVAPHTTVQNISILSRILEFLTSLPSIVSQRIITALIPLVDLSQALRDNLIMCLRKALFSRDPEIRQTAVHGFLHLLKYLKLQKVSALSQSTLTQTTYHGPSVFTQICMDVHTQQTSSQQMRPPQNPNINEALCLEIVGILKRCFGQQVSVKTILYKGLFAAICANPHLCTLALDVLLDHFSLYYENDKEVLPPLIFEKTMSARNSEVTLQEPIGHLLMLVQDVLCRTRIISSVLDDPDNEATRSIFKFTDIMKSLVDRFSRCELNHFELDKFTSFNDTSCDSMKTQETLRQILTVYEALIAYVTNTWNSDTRPETARELIELFKAYNQFIEFVKNSDKHGKKKEKDSITEDETTIIPSEKSGNKRKKSKKDKSGPKKCQFKLPNTILNLKTINRLLSLFLLEQIEWSSAEATAEIKSKTNLFRYSMNCALDAVRQLKVRLNDEQRTSAIFNEVVSSAKLIFLRCLSRYEEVVDFDFASAIISVECFSEIISLIVTHYKSKLSQFLEESIFVEASKGLPNQLLPILKVYKNLLKTVMEPKPEEYADEDFDMMYKLLAPTLLNAVSVVVLAFPTDHERTSKVLDWLILIADKYYFKLANNSKTFMNLLLTILNRCKSDLTYLDSLCLHLCRLFPSINETTHEDSGRSLLMITSESKTVILPMVCAALMTHLDDVDFMISRFKSENFIVNYLQNDEDNPITQYSILKSGEKKMCELVIHITIMAEELISIAAPTGPCLESIIKFLIRTFSVLTSLTKYFMTRSTAAEPVYQAALFHKLVKRAGSQFIRQEASDLILYVEKDYESENTSLSHLNNQAKKQLILLPKLVSELESFPKAVMQLSKKCKDTSLLSSIKLTITRDFRLNMKKVDELMSKQNESDLDEELEESNIDQPVHLSTKLTPEPSQKRKKIS